MIFAGSSGPKQRGVSIEQRIVRHPAEAQDGLEKLMTTTQRLVTGITAVGVPVGDQDRALAFYTEELGMEKRLDVPLPQLGGRWVTVAPPDSVTAIALVPVRAGHSTGVETGIRLATPDASALHNRLHDRGVDVDDLLRWPGVPPMFAFRDQDDNGLEIIEEASR
jgi:lactoylglutathione lyase